jgi:hypothetical protein
MDIFDFIQNNSINQIEQFINNVGGNVNIKDNDGYKPLIVALRNKNNKNIFTKKITIPNEMLNFI